LVGEITDYDILSFGGFSGCVTRYRRIGKFEPTTHHCYIKDIYGENKDLGKKDIKLLVNDIV
jgi:hypothetical protein